MILLCHNGKDYLTIEKCTNVNIIQLNIFEGLEANVLVLNENNCAKSIIVTEFGVYNIYVIKHSLSVLGDIVVLLKGKGELPLVRIHSECMTGDVFHSEMCDCCKQLHKSLEMISKSGYGILIYMRQEGRGIGLFEKIKAYELQRNGYDTVDANIKLGFQADSRKYDAAADILKALGIHRINIITNNPDKIQQMKELGIEIVKRIPCYIEPGKYNELYINCKKKRMGHLY